MSIGERHWDCCCRSHEQAQQEQEGVGLEEGGFGAVRDTAFAVGDAWNGRATCNMQQNEALNGVLVI